MTGPNERRQSPIGERTAQMLREQLELEFVAIHRRRTLARQIARVSAVATLVCIAAMGLWWSGRLWPNLSIPAGQLAQGGGIGRPSTNGSDASTPANSAPTYATIKVTDLSDDELRSLLASTQAQWFVAEIDGTPTAFPLEPGPRQQAPSSSLN